MGQVGGAQGRAKVTLRYESWGKEEEGEPKVGERRAGSGRESPPSPPTDPDLPD